MIEPDKLIGHRPPWSLKLTHLVEATARRFKSSRAPFQELWSGEGLHRGEAQLVIYQAPIAEGTLLERTSVFCQRLALQRGVAPPPVWDRGTLEAIGWLKPLRDGKPTAGGRFDEKLHDWTGASIGRALWSLGGFGSLCWDWDGLKEPDDGVAAAQEPAQEPAQRGSGSRAGQISADLAWDHGVADVVALRARVLQAVRELPRPAGSISRRRFEVIVTGDLDQLRVLCGKAGSVAHGLLDSPYARVERCKTLHANGRECLVWMETASDWFGVHLTLG